MKELIKDITDQIQYLNQSFRELAVKIDQMQLNNTNLTRDLDKKLLDPKTKIITNKKSKYQMYANKMKSDIQKKD